MPKKNTINDLRDHLFELIEDLKDGEKKIDVERAKLVISASQAIIESAKVEVQAIDLIGGSLESSQFLQLEAGAPEPKRPALLRKVGE